MAWSGAVMEPRTGASLAIGGRFKGYNPEAEKASGKADVHETVAIKQLTAAWKACGHGDGATTDDWYALMLGEVKGLRYSAKDVEGFSLALAGFQDEQGFAGKAGLFLSALMNNGDESDYTIQTKLFVALPDYIGYKNLKRITVRGGAGEWIGCHMEQGSILVEGSAGNSVGACMKDGSIIVEGNAEDWIGMDMVGGSVSVKGDAGFETGWRMRGGSIIVDGDAGDWVGSEMEGGNITIIGDAGEEVGREMRGGEIRLEGDYKNLHSHISGGTISHKGELIAGRPE